MIADIYKLQYWRTFHEFPQPSSYYPRPVHRMLE